MSTSELLRFAALGDLLFTAKPGSEPQYGRGLEAVSNDILKLFESCDAVLANLEATLKGPDTIPTEPRLVSTERQIRSLSEANVNIVTLGNNHAFDCMAEGFYRTRDLLNTLGIGWCGAGSNIDEALTPVIVDKRGVKLAFLCVVDPSVGPCRFSTETRGGVAILETRKVCDIIKVLRRDVHHVIVSPHWGKERYRIPSPEQIVQARAFVDAGASMVLGHHPHVLQGMEFYKGAPIVYSLGNFLTNFVYWSDGQHFYWNRLERTGCIFTAELDTDGVRKVSRIPIFDDGQTIRIERSGWGTRCLNKADRLLARGVTPRRYKLEAFRIEKLRPILYHLRWSDWRDIRPEHFRKALNIFTPQSR